MTSFRDAFPILYVEDVARAIDFYTSTLGFDVRFRWPGEGETTFAFLTLEPLGIGVSARSGAGHNPGRDFELCLYTDDADAAAERLRATGAEELMPPTDEPWRERRAYFRDPDGNLLHLAQKL